MKHYKSLMFAFAIAYITLIHSAFAQTPYQDTQSDRAQDAAGEQRAVEQDIAAARSVSAQDVENALLKEQIKQNSDALALMNARNAFWIQVLQTIMPILSALGIGIVGWLQVKAARERHMMAASINGMKTELVAVTRAAAFFEGAAMEAERHNPDVMPAVTRGQELSKIAQEASKEAHRLAAIAAGEKTGKKVEVEVETLVLDPGESATAEVSSKGTTVTKEASPGGKL